MKYRHKALDAEMLKRLEDIFRELLTGQGCWFIEFGGEADHVHLLFETPPTVKLSDIVRILKSTSARKMRAEYKEHLAPFYWKPYFWARSYGLISTGGRANRETLIRYVQNQETPLTTE
jgi:putative transposase